MSGSISSEAFSGRPVELSFPAPKGLDGHIHIHLTVSAASTILFLTSTSFGDSGSTIRSMGSFVCAIPDVCGQVKRHP